MSQLDLDAYPEISTTLFSMTITGEQGAGRFGAAQSMKMADRREGECSWLLAMDEISQPLLRIRSCLF